MKIVLLQKSHRDIYDTFLRSIDNSLLYYTLSYKEFIEQLLGCRSQYWIAVEDDHITGVLPLMEMEGKVGRIINSLPYFGSNGGVLSVTEQARKALHEKYNFVVQDPGVAAATLVSHPFIPTDESQVVYDILDERIGQFTTLPDNGNVEEGLLRSLDGSARRNIRKADKSNVNVDVDNMAIDFLEEVHNKNMEDIGGKAKSEEFFELLPRYFRPDEQYRIYVAKIGGKPVAALLVFYFNKTVEYFTPVTLKEYRNVQPMAKILFKAMMDAARQGFRWWNWGGTWISQEGVYKFKRKWGADDFRYSYYVKVNNTDILETREEDLLQWYPDFFVVPFRSLVP